jgi:hypothetical protein
VDIPDRRGDAFGGGGDDLETEIFQQIEWKNLTI